MDAGPPLDETHGGMNASSFISLFFHSAGRLMEGLIRRRGYERSDCRGSEERGEINKGGRGGKGVMEERCREMKKSRVCYGKKDYR